MPSPKDGKAGTPIIPDAPADAKPAVNAVSGKATTAKATPEKTKAGSYGSTKVAGASGDGGGGGGGAAGGAGGAGSSGGTAPATKPCAAVALEVTCDHETKKGSGKKRTAVNGRLQLVPLDGMKTAGHELTVAGLVKLSGEQSTRGHDQLHAKLTTNDGSDCKKEIAVTRSGAPGGGDWKAGQTRAETITGALVKGVWLDDAAPVIYRVYGRARPDESPLLVEVEVYPSYKFKGSVSINFLTEVAKKINDTLKDTVGHSLGGVSFVPVVTFPAGTLEVSCGWTEYQDWRAYHAWEVRAGLDPLVGLAVVLKVNLLALAGAEVGIPPSLTDYAAAIDVRLQVGGSVALSGRVAKVGPNDLEGSLQPKGNMFVELGLGARLGNEEIVSVELVGNARTGVTLSAEVVYHSGPTGGLTMQPKLDWDGLVVAVHLVVAAFSMEVVDASDSWTVFEPGTVWEAEAPWGLLANS